MAREFDMVVLGAGNAGIVAATTARDAGRSVALVEPREVGGTCPLRGCVPKKVLVAAAQAMDDIARAPAHGIRVDAPRLDWGALIRRERGFVEGVPASMEAGLEDKGVEVVHGPARFVDRDRLAVGDLELRAERIVVATGSRPRRLPVAGSEFMLTSEDILRMEELPPSIVFIGGGIIALEFAHVMVRAGCEVTVVEMAPSILSGMDADAVARLAEATERLGVRLVTGAEVREIAGASPGYEVRYRRDGQDRRVSAAAVANTAGRVATVADLDLDAAGVEHDGPRIAVDAYLRSVSNPRVFVAGDALEGTPQLSPVASYEGRAAAENALHGDRLAPDYASIPANVYTVPALCSVGMTGEEAAESGHRLRVSENDMADWRSARMHAEPTAYAKVIVEEGTGRILGAHMVGHGGEEVIQLFAFAMAHGLTADTLKTAVYAYPTFASDIPHML